MESIDNGMVKWYRCRGFFTICIVSWTLLRGFICDLHPQWLEPTNNIRCCRVFLSPWNKHKCYSLDFDNSLSRLYRLV